jgi:hypothetical protein
VTSQRRQRQVHTVGSAAGGAAAVASAPFGAAKLRDSYRESYPAKFGRRMGHLERIARQRGLSQQATSRVLRTVSHGKPGFVPLVTATTAATVAGGARRYERHLERRGVTKSAFGVELGKRRDGGGSERRTATAAGGATAGGILGYRAQQAVNIGRAERHLGGALVGASRAVAAPTGSDAAFHAIVASDRLRTARKYLARSSSRPRSAAAIAAGGLAGAGAGVAAHRRIAKSAFGVEFDRPAPLPSLLT